VPKTEGKSALPQKTLKRAVNLEGIGIHQGKPSHLRLSPLPPDSGIIFRRTDLAADIRCSASAVNNLKRSVGIGTEKASVTTVEHLLAALHLTGITNVLIETDSEEIAFLDGAGMEFIRAIRKAGMKDQGQVISPLAPATAILHSDNGDFIAYTPSERTMIVCTTDFPHPMLSRKTFILDLDNSDPIQAVAKARTFGFLKEVEELKRNGLGLGGSLDNTVLFTETGVANRKLNYPDEAVRHKVLDFLGDMYLTGRPIRGIFVLYKNGHRLDVEFLKKMLDQEAQS
jgi:UDP-3-O-[3-hydroxymyristoyl] N-acetylglucosamine deacetylase